MQAEWREAFEAKRTADTFETFWSAAIDQAAVHWILGVVFLRFLEDNRCRTQSLVKRSYSGTIRYVEAEHSLAKLRLRHEEAEAAGVSTLIASRSEAVGRQVPG